MDAERDLWDLRFNIIRSVRYHDRSRAVYDRLAKWSSVISLILSSGAVVAILKRDASGDLALYFSGITAVFAAINIVFGLSARANLHSSLRGKFVELLAKIEECKVPDEDTVKKFMRLRRDIEKDEPPVSRGLSVLCYNETVDAVGADSSNKKPLPWSSWWWNFLDAGQLGLPRNS